MTRSKTFHAAAALAAITMIAVAAFAAAPALARGGNGSITVPDGVFGGTTVATVNPGGTWVHAECFQDGVLVYEQYVRADENNEAVLTLGPTPMWTGGDATCTAEEGSWGKNGRFRVLASTDFQVVDQ